MSVTPGSTITVTGNGKEVEQGNVNNLTVNITGTRNEVELGNGSNNTVNASVSSSEIEMGNGAHDVANVIGNFNEIEMGDGAGDILNLTGNLNAVEMGNGAGDILNLTGNLNAVEMGNGAGDILNLTGNFNAVEMGNGAGDILNLTGNFNAVEMGDGDLGVLTLLGSSTQNLVFGGKGGDIFNMNATGLNYIIAGKGNDLFNVHSGQSILDGGKGNDTIVLDGFRNNYIITKITYSCIDRDHDDDRGDNRTYSYKITSITDPNLMVTFKNIEDLVFKGNYHEIPVNAALGDTAAQFTGANASGKALTDQAFMPGSLYSAPLTILGLMNVVDPNPGQAAISSVDAGVVIHGVYGDFVISASGAYTYTVNEGDGSGYQNAAHTIPLALKALTAGQSLTDTFTVHSVDGTLHNVAIQLNGVNDLAFIGGQDTGVVSDVISTATAAQRVVSFNASGHLTVQDFDAGQAAFQAGTVAGAYGNLTLDASGNWSYLLSTTNPNYNAVIKPLLSGQHVDDIIQVKSLDGTTHNIDITINGVDDSHPAIIGGQDTGVVSDVPSLPGNVSPQSSISGQLTIQDLDSGENAFQAGTVAGAYGNLTLSPNGLWTYSSATSNPSYIANVKPLIYGQHVDDIIQVKSLDGTTHNIDITINGVNDAAVIGGQDTGVVSDVISTATAAQRVVSFNASGHLTVQDFDAGQAAFQAGTVAGAYGNLTLDASGNWSYLLSTTNPNYNAVIKPLLSGQHVDDIIQVKSLDSTTHNIDITINGVDDAAVIGGQDTGVVSDVISTASQSVIHYSPSDGLTGASGDELSPSNQNVPSFNASGHLTVQDFDAGQAAFQAGTVAGAYGNLTLDASGNWSYLLDATNPNYNAVIKPLLSGQHVDDIIQVKSLDGTTHNIDITINGVDDAAVIGGQDTGVVSDVISTATAAQRVVSFNASGHLTVQDFDAGQAAFQAGTVAGAYGNLTLDASGNWSYLLSTTNPNYNAVIKPLLSGQHVDDIIQVKSLDGTTHNIDITINGVNDAAVIGGQDTGVVSDVISTATAALDALNQANLSAQHVLDLLNGTVGSYSPILPASFSTSGHLTVQDFDAGQAAFQAGTVAGAYGNLTLDASGNWSYKLDASNPNYNAVIKPLITGQHVDDIIQVKSLDGTTHNIDITINGVDDAAVIGGQDTGSFTDKPSLPGNVSPQSSISGQLTIQDLDSGENAFQAGTVAGAYGNLTLSPNGLWTYSSATSNPSYIANVKPLIYGQHVDDIIQVKSLDGTTHNIDITINGVKDPFLVTRVSGSVISTIHDQLNPTSPITVSGVFNVQGTDNMPLSVTLNGTSQYGTLVFDQTFLSSEAGSHFISWTYTLNEAQSHTILPGQTGSDNLSVNFSDNFGTGISQLLNFNIFGATHTQQNSIINASLVDSVHLVDNPYLTDWNVQWNGDNITNNSIVLGNGDDAVALSATQNIPGGTIHNNTISTGNGNDTVTLSANNDIPGTIYNNTINTGNGNDTVTLNATNNHPGTISGNIINTGDGNDTVSLLSSDLAFNNTINAGNGNNTIMLMSDHVSFNNTINTGNGNNTITVQALEQAPTNNIINLGSGSNIIHLQESHATSSPNTLSLDLSHHNGQNVVYGDTFTVDVLQFTHILDNNGDGLLSMGDLFIQQNINAQNNLEIHVFNGGVSIPADIIFADIHALTTSSLNIHLVADPSFTPH